MMAMNQIVSDSQRKKIIVYPDMRYLLHTTEVLTFWIFEEYRTLFYELKVVPSQAPYIS